MTTVVGTLSLSSVLVSSLSAPAVGYLVTFSEAVGAAAPAPVSVALDATLVSVDLEAGTWTAIVVAVDASSNAVTAPVASNTIVLAAPATVNVPVGLTLTAQ